MRLVAALALAVAGCAGASPRAPAPVKPPPAAPADAGVPIVALGEDVPSLEALAARGPTDMPLMREALRVADAGKPGELKVASDTCFRAVVAASGPVRAWFEDETHAPRGEVAAVTGLVPPRGPACARKGETLRLIVERTTPSSSLARAVVWQAP